MDLKDKLRPRIRTWLVLLVMVALMPVVLFSVYAIGQLSEREEQSMLRELRRRTQGVALILNGRLEAASVALNTLAQSDAAAQGDERDLYHFSIRLLQQTPSYRAITLVDADGNMAFHTSMPYGKPTFSPFERDLIVRALETRQTNVSGPFVAPISPQTVIAVTTPANIGGRFNKCLRIIMLSETVNDILRQQNLPPGWIAGVVDRNGVIVARTLDSNKYVGQRIGTAHLEAIKNQEKRFVQATSLDGIQTTTALAPIHHGDWYVGISVPNDLLHKPRHEMLQRMSLLAIAWITLSVIAATALAKYLVSQTRLVASALVEDNPANMPDKSIHVQELRDILLGMQKTQNDFDSTKSFLHDVEVDRDKVRDLYDNAPCGYHSLDQHGNIININQTELSWLGRTRDEVIGHPFLEFLSVSSKEIFLRNFPKFLAQGSIQNLEFELLVKDGRTLPILLNATAIRDSDGTYVMSRSTVFDITERKALERELDRLARTDSLTGLCNRREFYAIAEKEVTRGKRFDTPLSALLLDIDHFKAVNDEFGHAAGDEVLIQLGTIAKSVLRETDIPARIGGEEFAVLMPQTTLEQATEVAERLRSSLAQTAVISTDGAPISITVSIGVGQLEAADLTIGDLLQRCDKALYQAKNEGRNRVKQATGQRG